MIQIRNLTKVFRTDEIETVALNDINLDVKEGEFLAIMGPSGCGKSTLLNIIGLLDTPTSGSYRLNGEETAGLKESRLGNMRRGKIGFVFQNFNLIDEIDVAHNVEVPLAYLGMGRKERRGRVKAILDKVNLGHRGRHLPQQLSGGQQQRAAIARALVCSPRLILADEPTGNLDSKNGTEVMELLASLNREGTTIVMVTHSERDAAYADKVIHLFDGAIVGQTMKS